MGKQSPGVLTPDDLNETDGKVLDVLREGRVTPQYVADELDVSRTYASERLKRLVEHGHVAKLASGLYELVDDPRENGPAEDDRRDNVPTRAVVDDWLREHCHLGVDELEDTLDERDRLEADLADCREQLQRARADTEESTNDQLITAIKEAHEAASSAAERIPEDADGHMPLQDAVRLLEEAMDDGT